MIKALLDALRQEPHLSVAGIEFALDGDRLWLKFHGTNIGCWRRAEDLSVEGAPDLLVYEDSSGELELFDSPSDAVAHFEQLLLPSIRARLN